MQITFDRKTVNTCLQQRFVLPTYQRDYKWELKHLQDLLNDIQEAFLYARKPSDGRREVLDYEPYFLGTIIATPFEQGGKAIVDGQQRITTLTLLLAYAHRIAQNDESLQISPVEQAIRRRVAGVSEFNLNLDPARKRFFELLLDGPRDPEDLASEVDSIADKDSGTLQLWNLFQQFDSLISPDISDEGLLPHFFDYLTECVYLFEIGVPREQDGHKVFVTMNDRGLKLSPIDLLKGFLLSSIPNDESNRAAHASWTGSLRALRELGSDEDSAFFKTWIRAKYANTMRGKRGGEAPGDFEIVGDSYHRWMMDNKDTLALHDSDDFSNLVTGTIPYFVGLYCQIKSAEENFTPSMPHVFYNGARGLTLQAMVILSAIRHNDPTITANKKINAVSYYLDYLSTVRILNGKENTYDNVRDLMFELAKQVRDLNLPELKAILLQRIAGDTDTLDALKSTAYDKTKRQHLLHLLARLAHELETSLALPTAVGFSTYVDRDRYDRTFDIEHLLTNSIDKVNADLGPLGLPAFASRSEFETARNGIGDLILLPRGRNRSMKDMAYSEKITRYANENVLAQTLTNSFFLNQPNWTRFSQESGISVSPVAGVDITAIAVRANFYFEVAKRIWSSDELEKRFS